MRRSCVPSDAFLYDVPRIVHADAEHPAEAILGYCRRVFDEYLRASPEPRIVHEDLQAAGGCCVQGKRGGRLAFAIEPRDVLYAQFRI